ncbi:MAG: redoxin domain-containing protein [Chloroherpetonaceae bacterium]|nr:redoxin domain-containing protein [Chloroherpetonaceae bacterium]MDW8438257.1 peroxiredoxin family protein [Chloroherpetonaceae bacterium]
MPSLFESINPINANFISNFVPRLAEDKFQIGDLAPDFELPDSNGTPRKLSDFRGKPLLLVFTRIFTDKIFCPLCYPHLNNLKNDYAKFLEKGGDVVVVSTTNVEMTRQIVEEQRFPFTMLSDSEWRVFKRYGLGAALGAPLPAQFLLDKNGAIRFKYVSGLSLSDQLPTHPDNAQMLALMNA